MFQVGDKVYSINFGCGVVKKILGSECGSDYKVRVHFKDGRIETFTLEGKYFEDGFRDLFFEEIHIPKSALEKPRKTAKEMLDECEEVEFVRNKDNFYIYFYTPRNKVCYRKHNYSFLYGVKYISEEDAERIVKECKENNSGDE